ncbi:DUF748 domain-containing protein [Oleiharenicola lentus]|uniref:DUF748 domain-containing protein n=1 Tax=Oleiharenicola lentus TaxID=2508720 RepID=A0A4Q1C4D7_9BACT|nr:DUF748 domain-containing protein [Oleiharenicola lentus]RXK53119.1 DUF748 domain-containing protein [Oleiharenicola lentus]
MKPVQAPSRWRRKLWIAGGLLAAYAVGGFLVAPGIVKSQLEKHATAALGRTVTVGKVKVNPFAVSLTLEDLDVRLKEGTGSFLRWRRLYVNADPLTSVVGAWKLGAVELDGFQVTAILHPDGTFNFADILEKLTAAPAGAPAAGPGKPPPAVQVGRLVVQQAQLNFVDESRSRPFSTALGPVSFNLTEFHTTAERGAPYHFEAVSESGERFTWTGTISAAPLSSAGELKLENIQLPKYAAYYADFVQADLTGGRLSVGGRYEAKFDRENREMKLLGGTLQLRDLNLVERSNQHPVLALHELGIQGITADIFRHQAQIGTIGMGGGQLNVRREADGSINLLQLLPARTGPRANEMAVSSRASGGDPINFVIREIDLRDFGIVVEDLATPRSTPLATTIVRLGLLEVTLAEKAEIPLDMSLTWAPTGTVNVKGVLALMPELKASLQTDVAKFSLIPLGPYLERFANVHLAQGAASGSGMVTFQMSGDTPAITFDGGLTVAQLGLVDAAHNEPLVGFTSLSLTGLKASTAPQLTVSVDEVNFTAPYARVFVAKDGAFNLAALAQTSTPAAPAEGADPAPPAPLAPAPAQAAAPLPKITIGRVVIADGDFSFADGSLEPNVRLAVTQFGGTIAGLSSENLARADVDLKASVNGAGPIAITGRMDPLGVKKFVDLKVDFRNVDLVPLSPYSGKFAGFELARGQLNLDVKARLDDKQLDAENVITLNQFTFGAPVESPDATKLPVRLGVALLKDMDGKIVIDVPMTGSIDDPSLRIGKVVWRVIGNLLTKAATSPFALLGSMFGGGGDELAFQEFAPGGRELLPAETAKLATMVKALTNRPGLSLAIEGGFDAPADTAALRQHKLAALLRSRIWEEMRAANPNLPPPEQLEIAPEARAAMLKKLFDEKFPPGTELVAPPPPAPAVAAAPAPVRKNLLRRVVDAFTTPPAPATPAADPVVTTVPDPATATGPTPEEMTARLVETMEVTDNDLRALAESRAQRVRDYFLTEGKIAGDRLFLSAGSPTQAENKGPRVFLSLQ